MNNKNEAKVTLHKGPRPDSQDLIFRLDDIAWYDGDGIGPEGLGPTGRDLLEIARVVWEVERHMPKRVSSQRLRRVEVKMPLRLPGAWNTETLQTLTKMLRLLGNAEWTFDFSKRKGANDLDKLDEKATRTVDHSETVALFSGGLDSTCGLGWLKEKERSAALVSFFGPKTKQAQIANTLGFANHVQVGCVWQGARRRIGGQFNYRSMLFLALGGALARSFGATDLMQFENGPLALSAPPAPVYRMTRHAHPQLHQLASELLSALFAAKLTVHNPFLALTKREATEFLSSSLGKQEFKSIIADTETCWNLTSRQVLGDVLKKPGQPCGICIPCLVRRTALLDDPIVHAVDLTSREDPYFKNAGVRIHLDAFQAWAQKLLAKGYDLTRYEFDAPHVLREAIISSNSSFSMKDAYDLHRRFAAELKATFP
ncbi:hypothetical protein [Roseibium album]|uniref:hypothetical protein n=1 Tax=Roseibium album TaxID=311410 RepID=UPI003BAE45E1